MLDIDTLTDEFDALAAQFASDDLDTGDTRRLRYLANLLATEATDDRSGNDLIDAVLVETLVATQGAWWSLPGVPR